MVTPSHTPGPWELDDEGQVFARGALVASVDVHQYPGENAWDWDTAGANGALIAAAPDLLAALEDMLAGWRYIRSFHGDLYGVGWDRAQGKAEAAILKATGEAK